MSESRAWGYAFDSDHSLAAMAALLNVRGPWVWQVRDSTWYGDYLNCQPAGGLPPTSA